VYWTWRRDAGACDGGAGQLRELTPEASSRTQLEACSLASASKSCATSTLVPPRPAGRHRGSAGVDRSGGQCAGCTAHQPQPQDQHSMSASSSGMLGNTWRCTLSWIVALRAMGSVDAARSLGSGSPSLHHFRPHELDRERRTILLYIGIGLSICPVLQFGRLGVERHQLAEDPVHSPPAGSPFDPRCPCPRYRRARGGNAAARASEPGGSSRGTIAMAVVPV
jgi:hypothetical protein